MSTTIRVLKGDKERLEKLAKKLGARSLAEAFRLALAAAEREVERFEGNLDALIEALSFAAPIGGGISEKVDEELARAVEEE